MNSNYVSPYTPAPAQSKRRKYIIALIVGLVLLCCCCLAVAVAIVFADPFNWHIKDRLFGGTFDAAAEAMPEDTGFYVGVNLLNATPDQLDRFIQPFADAVNINKNSWDEIIRELDKNLSDALDLTITDDIKPWIGQYAGIGVYDIRINDNQHPVSLIIAIESRDNKAADNFIGKLRDSIEANNNISMDETKYQGVTIYSYQDEYGGAGYAFCRSGSLVLFSLKDTDLHTAIDAQKGKSLADNNRFHDMLAKMPDKRVGTAFFTSREVVNLINELQSQTGAVYDQINKDLGGTGTIPQTQINPINLDMWDAIGLSISITGAGLQLDTVTSYNLDKISAAQRELLNSLDKSSTAVGMFPEDTLAFITSQRLDLTYDVMLETVRSFSQDVSDSIDNALQSVRDETNIDLTEDLFHRLDGEFAIGIFPSSQGILAQQANVNLGFALLVESSDTGALANTIDTLASKREEGGAGVERSASGNLNLYEFLDQPGGNTIFSGGIEKKYVAIASSNQAIEDLFAGNPSLSKSIRYRDAISPLPDGVQPILYLDVEGILGTIRESLSGYSRQDFDQSVSVLGPIPYIVMGSSKLDNGFVRETLVIHVK
jgi:hypothetical protein